MAFPVVRRLQLANSSSSQHSCGILSLEYSCSTRLLETPLVWFLTVACTFIRQNRRKYCAQGVATKGTKKRVAVSAEQILISVLLLKASGNGPQGTNVEWLLRTVPYGRTSKYAIWWGWSVLTNTSISNPVRLVVGPKSPADLKVHKDNLLRTTGLRAFSCLQWRRAARMVLVKCPQQAFCHIY